MKKPIRKRELILFSVLIGLFLAAIIFSSKTQIDPNSNGVKFDENNTDLSKLPKTSGTQINITTPENKTYYKTMNGYYPATYGFENDENGDVPYGWNSIGTNVQVIPEEDSHNKVVELHDTDGLNHGINQSLPDKSSGTIEFWIKNSDNSKNVYMPISDGSAANRINIQLWGGNIIN